MARTFTVNDLTFTPPQRRLLGGWRDVLDDVRELAQGLTAMPDTCECGTNGTAIGSACSCCHPEKSGGPRGCDDCGTLMATCRTKMDTLLVDTLRFFPVFTLILAGSHPAETQTAASDVQHEIAALVRTFERVAVASDAYSDGCRASHLPILKAAANELQAHAQQLERLL